MRYGSSGIAFPSAKCDSRGDCSGAARSGQCALVKHMMYGTQKESGVPRESDTVFARQESAGRGEAYRQTGDGWEGIYIFRGANRECCACAFRP